MLLDNLKEGRHQNAVLLCPKETIVGLFERPPPRCNVEHFVIDRNADFNIKKKSFPTDFMLVFFLFIHPD